jgi:cytidine deaminase
VTELPNDLRELLDAARAVSQNAYAPYSGFKVGAALRADDGTVFVGCNVENATYGATVCAERSAIAGMVAAGRRRIVAVAVYADADEPALPCGICRQSLAEFTQDAPIVVAGHGDARIHTLAEIFPAPFTLRR